VREGDAAGTGGAYGRYVFGSDSGFKAHRVANGFLDAPRVGAFQDLLSGPVTIP